jgi:peptide/nickel transport system substrate-binding protein
VLNGKSIPPAGANVSRTNMPPVNAALDAAMAEMDDAKRLEKFRNVASVCNKELPWAPFWMSRRFGIVSTKVANFVWTPAPSGGGYDQKAEGWAFT